MRNKFLVLCAAVVSISGCGSSDAYFPQPYNPQGQYTSCPAGTFRIGSSACQYGDFRTACVRYGGTAKTIVGGGDACQTAVTSFAISGSLGRAGPSISPLYATGTGVTVRKYDVLTYTISGRYRHSQNASFNCSGGIDFGDSSQGLYGTDGTESFPMSGTSSKVINNDGYLGFGVNYTDTIACWYTDSDTLTLSRCMDINGNVAQCQ